VSETGREIEAFDVRDVRPEDRPTIRERLTESWGSTIVIAHGVEYDAAGLPGLLAVPPDDPDPLGLLTYRAEPDAWEVVTLDAFQEGIGVGTALLDELEHRAAAAGASRVWLITTNDNTHALRFYQRRGYDLTALRLGAVDAARTAKPEIPLIADGIAIRHELELAKPLSV
jgi:ribosomal protein S18 acetylase RimI-like enzyme